MAFKPLLPVEANDPELYSYLSKGRSIAFEPGAPGKKRETSDCGCPGLISWG